jgi:hypothetical protein
MSCATLSARALARCTLPALLAAAVSAGTHVVDPSGAGDFLGVSDALASPAVVAGDRVLVLPGTYFGALVVDRAIALEAVDGAGATTLDGSGAAPVVTLSAGAFLRGFTITGGDGPERAGGVLVTSTDPVWIEDCVIADNHPTGDAVVDLTVPGGGVVVQSDAHAWIVRSIVEENTSKSAGGISCGGRSQLHLIASKVRGNGAVGTITGGMVWGASGRIVDCEITGNWGSGGGAIFFAGGAPAPVGATLEILSSTIVANHGDSPMGSTGGLYLDDGGTLTIANTIVKDNSGSLPGDILVSPDFASPPVVGTVDLHHSHVGSLGSGVPPGLFMVPSFAAPEFTGPISHMDAPTSAGDFTLSPTSPELDAGADASHPLDVSARDVAGVARILGAAIDVGANERGTSCAMPRAYGLGKITSEGERPFVSTEGEPSVSGAGLSVRLHAARAGLAYVLMRGRERSYGELFGGTLLVGAPNARIAAGLIGAGGFTSNALTLTPILAGQTRCYQYWFRDPAHVDGTGVGLSNAVEVVFCP